MTEQQVEWYLTRLQSDLKREYVKEADDDDIYQLTSMDVLRDCGRYTVNNEREFMGVFGRYFLTIRKRHRANLMTLYRCRGAVYPLADYCNEIGECKLYHFSEDPRTDSVTMTYEYIELLPETHRPVFQLLYIEGMTQEEAATHLGVTQGRVSQIVTEGIAAIRAELANIG